MCLVNVIKEGLVTFSGNSILVMQRLGNVCLGTVTIIRLMSPILNIDFGGMDISYECCPSEFHLVYYLPTQGLVGKSEDTVI